jgi:HEPN domain-containing protein
MSCFLHLTKLGNGEVQQITSLVRLSEKERSSMNDLDHARSLLEMAMGDLNSLRGMTESTSAGKDFFSDEVFGFHAQQSAEKCLKAWVAALGKSYPRTHDLMVLIDTLNAEGEDTSSLNSLVDLNPFAVQYRYESLDSDDEELDRTSVLNEVQSLYDRVAATIDKLNS